jgi:pyruvate ferredoxin oxidoreductase gamma subunit
LIYEIRWHGRAGQGIITASRLLAEAALLEGKRAQAFPEFGAERLGAPVNGFTRIADEPIDIHSQIYEPDAVIVIDPSVYRIVDIKKGLKEEGILIANTKESPEGLKRLLSLEKVRIGTIDAAKIALEIFKRPIYNTTMIGAFLKAVPIVSLESVAKVTLKRFPGALGERNLEAIKRSYEEVVIVP